MITRIAKNRITNRRKKKYTFPTYNSDDIYKSFKIAQQELPEDIRVIISCKEFKDIVYEANKELSTMIASEGMCFKLPYSLGELSVIKSKVTFQDNELKAMIDWGHYNKTKEKKLFVLKEKDYRARWWWKKRLCRVKNKNMYSFTPTRTNTRKIAEVMQKQFGYNTYHTKSKL
jgi:hypothetical protein